MSAMIPPLRPPRWRWKSDDDGWTFVTPLESPMVGTIAPPAAPVTTTTTTLPSQLGAPLQPVQPEPSEEQSAAARAVIGELDAENEKSIWHAIRGTLFHRNAKGPVCRECSHITRMTRHVDRAFYYVRRTEDGRRWLMRSVHCHNATDQQVIEYASPPGIYDALKDFHCRPAFRKPEQKPEPEKKPEVETLREPRGTGL